MDAVKPTTTPTTTTTTNVSGLVHAFAKVLRLRASGIAPIDGIKKIKLPENCIDSAQKFIQSQPICDNGVKEEEEKMQKNREATEALFALLFASISAIKAAYAQLQIAQSPYDPDCIQSADGVIVSELKTLSELKHCHLQKQILPSQDSQLIAEIREQQNLLKTYDLMSKKLRSQLELQDSEILSLKQKLQGCDEKKDFLENKLNPNRTLSSSLDNLHLAGLNPTHFITAHHLTLKSIRTFVKLVIDEMVSANWDINAAADAIQPNTIYSKPSHKSLAFESYVCGKIFSGFQDPNFSIPSSSSAAASKQRIRKPRHHLKGFLDLKSRKAMEVLKEEPGSEFGDFCRVKYLSTVHPRMEASFFGDVRQRGVVGSGEGFPETPFFSAFAEMARWVWLLHCLGFSFEPEASIFQVGKGCCFSAVYMESAAEDGGERAAVGRRPRVGFAVAPGFRVGKTVLQCRVYLSPA